jgi:site-specific recombinase XerD
MHENIMKLEGEIMKMDYWVIEKELPKPKSKLIANEYLKELKYRGLAKQTINQHKRIIESFLLEYAQDIEFLESDNIKNWLQVRYGTLSASTFNNVLGIFRTFFKYCQDEGYIQKIPIKSYWNRITRESIPKYLTEYELALLQLHSANLSIRDRTIFNFLLTTGCQSLEVSGLNIEDIDFHECRVMVKGKRMKRRLISFSRYVAILVAILMEENLKNNPTNESALFLSKTGKRITPRGINEIIHRLGEVVGLRETLTPSQLRNTAIANMKMK